MPFVVLPGGSDVVIIGQKTLREKHGIDVMAQLQASLLKTQGREDGPEMEITAGGAVSEPMLVLWRGRRWLPRWLRRVVTRQVTRTITSHWRYCLNDP